MGSSTGWTLQFLQNICLFAAIVLCYREVIRAAHTERRRTVLLGVLFGVSAIVGVMLPVALPSGHAFDTEVLPIGLAALFGGPIAAVLATVIDGMFQLSLHGGGSLEHLVEPIVGALIGLCFLWFEQRRKTQVGLAGLLILGFLLATMPLIESVLVDGETLASLAKPALLYVLPSGLIGTLALGSLLRREDRIQTRERAAVQENKMLDAVIDSMSDALLAIDTDGKALVFNRPAREMFGDWRGEGYAAWKEGYQRYHLDRKTRMEWSDLALPRALQGLETNDLPVFVKSPTRPNGFVISVNGRPLRDASGKVIAGITVARDVSELMTAQQHLAESQEALKRSEERYALAFRGAYDGLWDRDLRTGQAFFSTRCFEIVGFPRMEDSAGRTVDYAWWTDRIHPEDSIRVLEARERSLQSGGSSFEIEYRIRRTNGTFCWVSDRGAISRDKLRSPFRVAGSFTDISARKLAEEQRRALEAQLQQAQKTDAIGTLAGGIAHDINNTLVPIIGTVEMLLLDAQPDSALGKDLEDIMSAAVKISELVRQILTFSRDEGSERGLVDMGSEMASTLRMLRSMVPATISLDLGACSREFICNINTTQLHQVVMNLVSNAVSAIGSARGAIRIALERVDLKDGAAMPDENARPGGFCRISVVDTGPGVAPDVKPRLFDPFFTTKPVGEGTGLGLSVVLGIVRDHGGYILVGNEPGKGARFDVHFPLVEQTTATEPVKKAS